MISNSDIKSIIAETFNLNVEDVSDSAAMGSLRGWDSIGHLNLMQSLSEQCNKEVPFDQVTELVDLKALVHFFNA
jgi:acyl carrier protein